MQLSYFSMMLVASGVSGGMSGASKLLHDYSSDGQGMAMTFSGAAPTLRITDTTTPSNNWDSGLGTGYTVQDFFKTRSFTSYTGPVSTGKRLMQADGYIKPCRHNLLGMSQHIESAAWSVQNGSIIQKTAITVPSVGSGSTTSALRASAGAGIQAAVYQNKTITANVPFTMSCYAYAGTTPYIALNIYVNSVSYAIGVFDLSAGAGSATETFVGGTSGTIYSTAITDAGGGWYRCSITASVGSSSAYTFYQLAGAATGNTINAGQVRFAAAGTEDVYFWGCQLSNGYLLDYVSSEAHNLCLQSQTFQTTWSPTNTGVTADATTAPDGTTTADKLTETAVTDTFRVSMTITSISGTNYTCTVRAKAAERSWVLLRTNFGSVIDSYFNCSTGAQGTIGSGHTAHTPVALANGWYEFSVTVASTTTGSSFFNVGPANADAAGSYAGTLSSGIYVWGAQVELSSAPGKYVATTTTAVYNQHFDLPVEYNTNGTVKALTREEARTNLLTYSTVLNSASGGWTEQQASPVLNYATAPDGTTTATRLIDNVAGGTNVVDVNKSVTVSTSTAYTASIYAKADQLSWLAIAARFFTTPADGYTYFNLSTGAVGTTAAGHTAAITSVGNGWYRCSITFTTDAADTGGIIYYHAADGDTDHTVDLDGTSSILIWQAQFEAGSTASSPIVTGSATVTRAADVITWPTTIFPYNDTVGTWYAKHFSPSNTVAGARIISDNVQNRTMIQMRSTTYYGYYDGTTNTTNTDATLTLGTTNKVANAYSGSAGVMLSNAGIASSTSFDGAFNVTTVLLGMQNSGPNDSNCPFYEIMYVPSALSDSSMQTLTTP